MIRLFLILLVFGGLFTSAEHSEKHFRSIEKTFPLIWKAKVGSACFRGNILIDSNQIVFGSNGYNFMDYYLYDNLSGLYLLNPQNGKVMKHVIGNKLGDMDVNGVLKYNDKLYYGNDNEELICSSRNGDILWILPTSGDIEHEPILITGKERTMIVYATESGEVCAIDPSSGKKYWSYFAPDFQGWKPGDNRAIFKVKAYFSNSQSFFTKPSVADLDKDGINDLVYVTDNHKIIAINGKSGRSEWIIDDPKSMYDNTITNVGNTSTPLFAVKKVTSDSTHDYTRELVLLNSKGKDVSRHPLGEDEFQFGLNSVYTQNGMTVFCLRKSILMTDASGHFKRISYKRDFNTKNWKGDSVIESRNSNASMIAQSTFSYKGHNNCILILNQHDYAFFEYGFIEIVSLDSKKVLGTWQLPAGSELTPVIADVNKDGKLDVLINGYDGYLYCYALGIATSNIKYTNTNN